MSSDIGNGSSMHERLKAKCLQKFKFDFDLTECYYLLVAVFKLETSGIPSCSSADQSEPEVTHNIEFYSSCSSVERHIAQYAFPILQILCLFGNVINLLIYRLPYFHGSSAVYFLRAKAIANIIFVESRTFEVFHAWFYALGIDNFSNSFEVIYWNTKPFIITIANISGTLSTWMTLYITIETVICVLMPFSFRKYCTRKKTLWLLITSVIISIFLHLIFLCTHEVKTKLMVLDSQSLLNFTSTTYNTITTKNETDHESKTVARRSGGISDSFGTTNWSGSDTVQDFTNVELKHCWQLLLSYTMQPIPALLANKIYEKIYYWLQMMASIVLPTLAMLLCSLLIVTQFTFKELGEAFSQRRKCVIRLTVATTLSHLLLEGPALLTFGAVASKGAFVQYHNTEICVMNHANNLLSVINATIPFFVFLVCNQQFRQMSALFLRFPTSDALQRHKKYSTTSAVTTMPFPSPRLPTVSSIGERNDSNLSNFRSQKQIKDTLYYNGNNAKKLNQTKSSDAAQPSQIKTAAQSSRLSRRYSETELLIQPSSNSLACINGGVETKFSFCDTDVKDEKFATMFTEQISKSTPLTYI